CKRFQKIFCVYTHNNLRNIVAKLRNNLWTSATHSLNITSYPRLIVIEDEAWLFFRELFETEDYNCMISGKNYNFCMRSDIEANRGWAEALAKMSYRGEKVKMRIEKKEMERLLEEGRAVYYRDFL
ncbi:MAG: hypothetical protein II527_02195, partial [Bacteroidales bacterium]|nr:hypothetical protein [Bacteroidales bacterium]